MWSDWAPSCWQRHGQTLGRRRRHVGTNSGKHVCRPSCEASEARRLVDGGACARGGPCKQNRTRNCGPLHVTWPVGPPPVAQCRGTFRTRACWPAYSHACGDRQACGGGSAHILRRRGRGGLALPVPQRTPYTASTGGSVAMRWQTWEGACQAWDDLGGRAARLGGSALPAAGLGGQCSRGGWRARPAGSLCRPAAGLGGQCSRGPAGGWTGGGGGGRVGRPRPAAAAFYTAAGSAPAPDGLKYRPFGARPWQVLQMGGRFGSL